MHQSIASSCTYNPCTCATLRRASRAVTQLYDLVLVPANVKATQFIILKGIHEAREIAQCRYAKENGIAVETLSRRFASLRRKGLLQMRVGEHGERLYALTKKGDQLFSQALPYWERAQARLMARLGENDSRSLLAICDRVWHAAHEAEEFRTRNGFEIPLRDTQDWPRPQIKVLPPKQSIANAQERQLPPAPPALLSAPHSPDRQQRSDNIRMLRPPAFRD